MRVLALPLVLALAAPLAAVAAPAPHVPVIERPDWKRRPTGQDMTRVWPDITKSGVARIRCRVDVEGLLYGCAVVSEIPPGAGAARRRSSSPPPSA